MATKKANKPTALDKKIAASTPEQQRAYARLMAQAGNNGAPTKKGSRKKG